MQNLKKTAIAAGIATLVTQAWAQEEPVPEEKVVVVSGQRSALQSAQKLKQNADEIVDSVVAEDIGKLPDRSITEVLSRVVGVTMDRSMQGDPQHYAVEGSGIAIRGLSYVRSELNGRESFSANGGRSLSFADVPPELMAGVDVYKNPSAEQIEGGISGLVNLRTAMPFDYKGFKGSATYQSSYSTQREGKATPSSSLLLSDRWKTPLGEIGALIDLAASQSHTRTDEMFVDAYFPRTDLVEGKTVWVPRGAQWRSMNWERDRKGAYGALQWRPVRELTTALTFFKSRYKETWSERFTGVGNSPYDMEVSDATWSDSGALLSGTLTMPDGRGTPFVAARRASERNSSTTDVALNAEWRLAPDWTVRGDLQRVRAKTEGFDSEVAAAINLPKQRLDLTGKYPSIIFDAADTAYLADANNYYWDHTMEHRDNSHADSKAARLDFKHDFDSDVLRDVRFGVRLTERDSLNQNSVPSYNWQAVTPAWMLGWRVQRLASLGDPNFALGQQTTLSGIPNFFGGSVSVPAAIYPNASLVTDYPGAYATLHSYHDQLCAEMRAAVGWGDCPAAWQPAAYGTDPAGDNRQSEKTKALYAQLRFGWDKLKYPIDGNIGLRYVKTNSTAHGYTIFSRTIPTFPADRNVVGADLIPDIPNFATAQDFKNSYHNFLPTLNLRLKVSEELQFRAAFGSSMSRPDFSQLQAYTTLGQGFRTVTDEDTNTVTVSNVEHTGGSAGNPNLRPTTARSLDLSAEWYFAKSGSLTAALFYKKLKDIVVDEMFIYQVPDVNGKMVNFQVTGPVNGANGYARGFEVAYQQYFDNLPDLLKGIGVQASLTFVDSQRKLKDMVYSAYCSGGDGATNFNLAINGCDTDGRSFGNLPLTGLSRRTINFAVMYDRGPVSARLAYNWRSKYLAGVNNWGTRGTDGTDTNPDSATYGVTNQAWGLPLWQLAYGQLDGSIFYSVTPKFRIGLEAQNITNAISRQVMQQHIGEMGRAWFSSGPRYTIQAQYTF
ncbi:TonB-dependent receptor [Duganella sp. FT80W]|uniref:TonB-dependent receptor n=1 Tax=Duganella guangzhouensis TaxID=2666084 RepID=A0A6I2KSN9_9BURK|nr:TonB-dependent receptor [Duganella guangzhouensis]MRW88501.1 TonB-dependent receptor [Duganella guangzhouensis]